MTFDRKSLAELFEQTDRLIAQLPIGDSLRVTVKEKVFGPAFAELRHLISESRAPALYMLGRSGDGKSSLVNALAERSVATVGDLEPTTAAAEEHEIDFGGECRWTVWDSRGLFESTRPAGASARSALEAVHDDLAARRPDVICHVVASPNLRSFSEDLRALAEISAYTRKRRGAMPPIVMVLTKPDIEGRPAAWPPEIYPEKAELVRARLDYGAGLVGGLPLQPISDWQPWRGGFTRGGDYYALVPVKVLPGDVFWNLDALRLIIGKKLPASARLQFYQATGSIELAKQICESFVGDVAKAAAAVAALPIPLEDILLITPLQLAMIAFIGAMAGKPLLQKTALEFLAAAGVNVAGGLVLRQAATALMKLIPGAGSVVGATVAYSGTLALGKSAMAYFFNGIKPA